MCSFCQGTGFLDHAGLCLDRCPSCTDAVAEPFDAKQARIKGSQEWADDGCPEGIAGTVEDLRWLLGYVAANSPPTAKQ